MKAISLHVSDPAYQELKALAARTGRPVAELIRQGMGEYLERARTTGRSVLGLAPHESGRLRRSWTRSELLDEMRDR
jgi:predicted transcriptional regulator